MAREGAYFWWQAFASIVLFADVENVPNFSEVSKAKARKIYANAENVLGWLKKHEVKVVGGSDLFSIPIIDRVIDDVVVKQKYFSAIEVLRMHTSIAGELLALSGPKNPYIEARIGVLEPGAWADLLLVQGELLEDLNVLLDADNVRLIVKNGQVYKSL